MSNHSMITRSKRKRLNSESSDDETTDTELFDSDESEESEESPKTIEDGDSFQIATSNLTISLA